MIGMQQCSLCQTIFEGKTTGKLANHIRKIHGLSFQNYIILTQYSGVAPQCACGLCDEQPFFSRGAFSKYALDHEKFKVREKLYVQKYGNPKCLHCGNDVDFYRGEPRQFCSHICSGLHNGGFTKKETQNRIKNVVFERYGVSNIMHIPSIQKKISTQQMGENNSFYGFKHSEASLKIISEKSKLAWNNDDRRVSFRNIMHVVRKRNWQNPVYRKTILQGNLNGKHSKLHQRISEQLGLKELGFESEKVVFRYRVDEINFDKKIIVEINGDYIHANPTKFKSNDVIILRSSQYTAKDKWNYDQKRKEALEVLGFKLFVVWQSDNLDEKKLELYQLLGIK
jgi:very-short-patch-repair endonuclease